MPQLRVDAPPVIYHICGVENFLRDVDTLLRGRSVFLASPSKVNDPYELSPRLCIPPPEEWEADIVQAIGWAQARYASEADPDAIERRIRSHARALLTDKFSQAAYRKEIVAEKLGRCGVGSYTEAIDSPVLWAHYGSRGKGFAVGYRAQTRDELEAMPAFPVKYSVDRPCIHPFGKSDPLPILMTKYMDWEYEREWRYVRTGPDGGPGLFPAPRGSILEVLLGYDMSYEHESVVAAMATGIEEVPQIRKGHLCEETYRVLFRDGF